MRLRKFTVAVGLLVLSAAAEAHGEEVLVSLFAEAVTVLGILLALGVSRPLRAHAGAGVFGCIAGVVLDWHLTGDLPYRENQRLITLLGIAIPLLLSAAFVLLASRYRAKRGA